MKVSAQYAQEHFAELLESADHGQEIEIAREGKPTAKLIIMPSQAEPAIRRGPIVLGAGVGELAVPTDEEWRQMKDEDARYWDNATLMTSGEI